MQFIDLSIMGSSLVKQTRQMLNSQQYEWQLKSTSAFSSTVIDRSSRIQAERFIVDYAIFERECMLYVLRRSQQKHLVTVLDVIGQRQEEAICNSSREVAIIIEPVPYRLSDLGSLSFVQGMYVLKCVLEGYRVLLAQGLGFYLLDQAAICFTRSGVCKFWINQNLQMPRPNSNRLLSEPAFLAALLETVDLRVSSLPSEYIKARQKAQPLNCSKLLSVVQRFRDPQVKAMPSLSSMQMYSPHSTNYESSGKSMRGEGKLSVSKFRKGQRRRQSKRESPCRQDQHAKMSLSFSKNQAEKHKIQHLFVSPCKQVRSVIDPSLINSRFSSRQPSKLRSTYLTPDSLFQ